MSHIDHKARTLFLLEGVHDYQSDEGQTDGTALSVAIEAQVQATLYLAEQQTRSAVAAEKTNVALASILVVMTAGLSNGQQQQASVLLSKAGLS